MDSDEFTKLWAASRGKSQISLKEQLEFDQRIKAERSRAKKERIARDLARIKTKIAVEKSIYVSPANRTEPCPRCGSEHTLKRSTGDSKCNACRRIWWRHRGRLAMVLEGG